MGYKMPRRGFKGCQKLALYGNVFLMERLVKGGEIKPQEVKDAHWVTLKLVVNVGIKHIVA